MSLDGSGDHRSRISSPFAAPEVQRAALDAPREAVAPPVPPAPPTAGAADAGAAGGEEGTVTSFTRSVDQFDFLSKLIVDPSQPPGAGRTGALLRWAPHPAARSARAGAAWGCLQTAPPTISSRALLHRAAPAAPAAHSPWPCPPPVAAASLLPDIDWDVPDIKPSGNLDSLLPSEASQVLLAQQRMVSGALRAGLAGGSSCGHALPWQQQRSCGTRGPSWRATRACPAPTCRAAG